VNCQLHSITPWPSGVCGNAFAALPPDVRKGCALPGRLKESVATPQNSGAQPQLIWVHVRWGKATTAHRAAQPRNMH